MYKSAGQIVPYMSFLSHQEENDLFQDRHWILYRKDLSGRHALFEKGSPHFIWFGIYSGLGLKGKGFLVLYILHFGPKKQSHSVYEAIPECSAGNGLGRRLA